MKCDVSSILKTEGAVLPVGGSVEFTERSLSGAGPVFNDDVRFEGQIVNIGRMLSFSGRVWGSFQVLCARCLKEMTKTFDLTFSEMLANSSEDITDRDEVVLFDGYTVELDDILESNILVNLSQKYLCSEDCKGLCPVCGADLNISDCGCRREEIDPRLAGLKKLLEEY